MSTDYTNVQETTFTISTPSAAITEKTMWSKTKQWRLIGLDLRIVTAPSTGAGVQVLNSGTTVLTQDLATSAAGTCYELRVAAGSSLVNPTDTTSVNVVVVNSLSTDAAGVIDCKLIHGRTSA